MRKKDLILVSVLIIGGLVFYFIQQNNSSNLYAQITHGSTVAKLNINENGAFSLPELPRVIFEVRNNRVAFVFSDCPDQLCVNAGFLNRAGQMAACLPNGLILSVHSYETSEDDLDIILP